MRNTRLSFLAFLAFLAAILIWSCRPAQQEPAATEETPAAKSEGADPTVVAPDHYKVLLDNDRVRVLGIQYREGEEAPMHFHPEGVAVFLEDGRVQMTLPDGTSQELSANAGEAMWAPAGSHAPKALTAVSVIQVELKAGGGGQTAKPDPDSVAVAPDHYKVEFENERVRLLRINYAAGDQTESHAHPDGVIVFLEDGTAEMTLADGTKQERGGKAGEVLWAPAETHAPKASTGISVIFVELKS